MTKQKNIDDIWKAEVEKTGLKGRNNNKEE